jgi:hypothetical protein
MTNKPFLDELMHFTIHEHEFNQLPIKTQEAFKEFEDVGYGWVLVKDRPAKFRELLRKYIIQVKKHKGKESGQECITLDCMIYLLEHMNAKEIRKLKLHKLLTK